MDIKIHIPTPREALGYWKAALLLAMVAALLVLSIRDVSVASATITSPDTVDNVGVHTSLALDASGFPVVSYYNITIHDLKVLHCGDATCTSGNSITSPDVEGDVGLWASLVLDADGYPVVSYSRSDWPSIGVKVLHCGDDECTGKPIAGDVNCDSSVNSIDAVLLLQFDARLVQSLRCQENGDVNADGALTALDAALVLQYDAGLIDVLQM